MRYVIFNTTDANLIDFNLVKETSLETVRLSLDSTKCVLQYEGDAPAFLAGLQQYSYSELLEIIST